MTGTIQSCTIQRKGGRLMFKTFLVFTLVQAFAYLVLVYNFRMIASQNIKWALLTDGIYATLFFLIVRKIAKDESWPAGVGYVAGSLIGTYLGMVV